MLLNYCTIHSNYLTYFLLSIFCNWYFIFYCYYYSIIHKLYAIINILLLYFCTYDIIYNIYNNIIHYIFICCLRFVYFIDYTLNYLLLLLTLSYIYYLHCTVVVPYHMYYHKGSINYLCYCIFGVSICKYLSF